MVKLINQINSPVALTNTKRIQNDNNNFSGIQSSQISTIETRDEGVKSSNNPLKIISDKIGQFFSAGSAEFIDNYTTLNFMA